MIRLYFCSSVAALIPCYGRAPIHEALPVFHSQLERYERPFAAYPCSSFWASLGELSHHFALPHFTKVEERNQGKIYTDAAMWGTRLKNPRLAYSMSL